MGNYLSTPNCTKTSSNGTSSTLRYGASSMQGWRLTMEDCHMSLLSPFPHLPNVKMFAVFDGHGGSHVSRFAAAHMLEEMHKTQYLSQGKLAEALASSFLAIDQLLFKEEYQHELGQLSLKPACIEAPFGSLLSGSTDEGLEGDGDRSPHDVQGVAVTADASPQNSRGRRTIARLKRKLSPNAGIQALPKSAVSLPSRAAGNHREVVGTSEIVDDTKQEETISSNLNGDEDTDHSDACVFDMVEEVNEGKLVDDGSSESISTEEEGFGALYGERHAVADGSLDDDQFQDAENGRSSGRDTWSSSVNERVKHDGSPSGASHALPGSADVPEDMGHQPNSPQGKNEASSLHNRMGRNIFRAGSRHHRWEGKKEKQSGNRERQNVEPKERRNPLSRIRNEFHRSHRSGVTCSSENAPNVKTSSADATQQSRGGSASAQGSDEIPSVPLAESQSFTSSTASPTGGLFSSIKGAISNVVAAGRMMLWNPFGRTHQPVSSLALYAGCTSVVTIITENQIVVANAGDSRAVLCRGTAAYDLSLDHKPNLPSEKSRIYYAGGYLEMGRVNGNLNLSRAIGDLIYKSDPSLPPERQIVIAKPDLRTVDIREQDEFIVIGCDGIWEKSDSSQYVIDFVRSRIDTTEILSDIVEDLFEELLSPNPAIFEYGCDNMTAVVVDLKPWSRSCLNGAAKGSVPRIAGVTPTTTARTTTVDPTTMTAAPAKGTTANGCFAPVPICPKVEDVPAGVTVMNCDFDGFESPLAQERNPSGKYDVADLGSSEMRGDLANQSDETE